MASLAYMPTVQKELMQKGATFTRFYAHVPVCCPSRSSLISGQYMHNNGCSGNGIPTNCSSPAFQSGPEKRSYTTYLAAAGYKTSFAGKYLNDYGDPTAGGLAHVPPGWTNWQGLKGNSVYYNYSLSNNGVPEHHGIDYATDYLPNVIRNKTLDFLAANLGGPAPVFAVLSTPSCHGPKDAAPQYQGAFPGAAAPRLPNYNATVAGAPPVHWLQASHGAYVFHDGGRLCGPRVPPPPADAAHRGRHPGGRGGRGGRRGRVGQHLFRVHRGQRVPHGAVWARIRQAQRL